MSLIQLLEPIRGVIKKQWRCLSCLAEIELDTHGRCSSCGSDAVYRIGRAALLMTAGRLRAAGIPAEGSREPPR
jgi:predicted RNA-binding Zn-ribbon protein involved in translation (DUF1610 family)